MRGVWGPRAYSRMVPSGAHTSRISRGRGSGRRSQASPVSLACSSAVSLLERPQITRVESSRCAVTMIASNTSVAGTTSKRDWLAFFFGDGHGRGEQFLLVVIEDLAGFKDGAAAETVLAMVQASAHHHDILLAGVGVAQNVSQVIQIARIAHRHQNIAGAHSHSAAAQFLIAVDAELVELLGLAVAFFGYVMLGDGKDGEEDYAEDYAGDRGLGTW